MPPASPVPGSPTKPVTIHSQEAHLLQEASPVAQKTQLGSKSPANLQHLEAAEAQGKVLPLENRLLWRQLHTDRGT